MESKFWFSFFVAVFSFFTVLALVATFAVTAVSAATSEALSDEDVRPEFKFGWSRAEVRSIAVARRLIGPVLSLVGLPLQSGAKALTISGVLLTWGRRGVAVRVSGVRLRLQVSEGDLARPRIADAPRVPSGPTPTAADHVTARNLSALDRLLWDFGGGFKPFSRTDVRRDNSRGSRVRRAWRGAVSRYGPWAVQRAIQLASSLVSVAVSDIALELELRSSHEGPAVRSQTAAPRPVLAFGWAPAGPSDPALQRRTAHRLVLEVGAALFGAAAAVDSLPGGGLGLDVRGVRASIEEILSPAGAGGPSGAGAAFSLRTIPILRNWALSAALTSTADVSDGAHASPPGGRGGLGGGETPDSAAQLARSPSFAALSLSKLSRLGKGLRGLEPAGPVKGDGRETASEAGRARAAGSKRSPWISLGLQLSCKALEVSVPLEAFPPLVGLVSDIQDHVQHARYRSTRPAVSVGQDPRAWWRHAVRQVLSELRSYKEEGRGKAVASALFRLQQGNAEVGVRRPAAPQVAWGGALRRMFSGRREGQRPHEMRQAENGTLRKEHRQVYDRLASCSSHWESAPREVRYGLLTRLGRSLSRRWHPDPRQTTLSPQRLRLLRARLAELDEALGPEEATWRRVEAALKHHARLQGGSAKDTATAAHVALSIAQLGPSTSPDSLVSWSRKLLYGETSDGAAQEGGNPAQSTGRGPSAADSSPTLGLVVEFSCPAVRVEVVNASAQLGGLSASSTIAVLPTGLPTCAATAALSDIRVEFGGDPHLAAAAAASKGQDGPFPVQPFLVVSRAAPASPHTAAAGHRRPTSPGFPGSDALSDWDASSTTSQVPAPGVPFRRGLPVAAADVAASETGFDPILSFRASLDGPGGPVAGRASLDLSGTLRPLEVTLQTDPAAVVAALKPWTTEVLAVLQSLSGSPGPVLGAAPAALPPSVASFTLAGLPVARLDIEAVSIYVVGPADHEDGFGAGSRGVAVSLRRALVEARPGLGSASDLDALELPDAGFFSELGSGLAAVLDAPGPRSRLAQTPVFSMFGASARAQVSCRTFGLSGPQPQHGLLVDLPLSASALVLESTLRGPSGPTGILAAASVVGQPARGPGLESRNPAAIAISLSPGQLGLLASLGGSLASGIALLPPSRAPKGPPKAPQPTARRVRPLLMRAAGSEASARSASPFKGPFLAAAAHLGVVEASVPPEALRDTRAPAVKSVAAPGFMVRIGPFRALAVSKEDETSEASLSVGALSLGLLELGSSAVTGKGAGLRAPGLSLKPILDIFSEEASEPYEIVPATPSPAVSVSVSAASIPLFDPLSPGSLASLGLDHLPSSSRTGSGFRPALSRIGVDCVLSSLSASLDIDAVEAALQAVADMIDVVSTTIERLSHAAGRLDAALPGTPLSQSTAPGSTAGAKDGSAQGWAAEAGAAAGAALAAASAASAGPQGQLGQALGQDSGSCLDLSVRVTMRERAALTVRVAARGYDVGDVVISGVASLTQIGILSTAIRSAALFCAASPTSAAQTLVSGGARPASEARDGSREGFLTLDSSTRAEAARALAAVLPHEGFRTVLELIEYQILDRSPGGRDFLAPARSPDGAPALSMELRKGPGAPATAAFGSVGGGESDIASHPAWLLADGASGQKGAVLAPPVAEGPLRWGNGMLLQARSPTIYFSLGFLLDILGLVDLLISISATKVAPEAAVTAPSSIPSASSTAPPSPPFPIRLVIRDASIHLPTSTGVSAFPPAAATDSYSVQNPSRSASRSYRSAASKAEGERGPKRELSAHVAYVEFRLPGLPGRPASAGPVRVPSFIPGHSREPSIDTEGTGDVAPAFQLGKDSGARQAALAEWGWEAGVEAGIAGALELLQPDTQQGILFDPAPLWALVWDGMAIGAVLSGADAGMGLSGTEQGASVLRKFNGSVLGLQGTSGRNHIQLHMPSTVGICLGRVATTVLMEAIGGNLASKGRLAAKLAVIAGATMAPVSAAVMPAAPVVPLSMPPEAHPRGPNVATQAPLGASSERTGQDRPLSLRLAAVKTSIGIDLRACKVEIFEPAKPTSKPDVASGAWHATSTGPRPFLRLSARRIATSVLLPTTGDGDDVQTVEVRASIEAFRLVDLGLRPDGPGVTLLRVPALYTSDEDPLLQTVPSSSQLLGGPESKAPKPSHASASDASSSSAARTAVSVIVATWSDGTTAVHATLRAAQAVWPYVASPGPFTQIVTALVPLPRPAGRPEVFHTDPLPWTHVRASVEGFQLVIPVPSALPVSAPSGPFQPFVFSARKNLDPTRGLVVGLRGARVALSVGGDGESDVAAEVEGLGARLRPGPGEGGVRSLLLPMSLSVRAYSKYPFVEEQKELQRRSAAARVIVRAIRRYRLRLRLEAHHRRERAGAEHTRRALMLTPMPSSRWYAGSGAESMDPDEEDTQTLRRPVTLVPVPEAGGSSAAVQGPEPVAAEPVPALALSRAASSAGLTLAPVPAVPIADTTAVTAPTDAAAPISYASTLIAANLLTQLLGDVQLADASGSQHKASPAPQDPAAAMATLPAFPLVTRASVSIGRTLVRVPLSAASLFSDMGIIALQQSGGVGEPPTVPEVPELEALTSGAQVFRPATIDLEVSTESYLALALCDDRPSTHGAPDVLQAALSSMKATVGVKSENPGIRGDIWARLGARAAVKHLSCDLGRWTEVMENWMFNLEVGDVLPAGWTPVPLPPIPIPAPSMEPSGSGEDHHERQSRIPKPRPPPREFALRLTSEDRASLLVAPDLIQTLAECLEAGKRFGEAFSRRLPEAAAELNSDPSSQARTQSSDPPLPEPLDTLVQHNSGEPFTSRAPQRYVVRNQTGARLWYWGGTEPSAGEVYSVPDGSEEEMRCDPVRLPMAVTDIAVSPIKKGPLGGSFASGSGLGASSGGMAAAALCIGLQAEGNFRPVLGVNVEVVTRSRYLLTSPLDSQATIPLIVDVTTAGRVKMITVRGAYVLKNRLDRPVTLRVRVAAQQIAARPVGVRTIHPAPQPRAGEAIHPGPGLSAAGTGAEASGALGSPSSASLAQRVPVAGPVLSRAPTGAAGAFSTGMDAPQRGNQRIPALRLPEPGSGARADASALDATASAFPEDHGVHALVLGPIPPGRTVQLPVTASLGADVFVSVDGFLEDMRQAIRLGPCVSDLAAQEGPLRFVPRSSATDAAHHIALDPDPTPDDYYCLLQCRLPQALGTFGITEAEESDAEEEDPGEIQEDPESSRAPVGTNLINLAFRYDGERVIASRVAEPVEARLALTPTMKIANSLPVPLALTLGVALPGFGSPFGGRAKGRVSTSADGPPREGSNRSMVPDSPRGLGRFSSTSVVIRPPGSGLVPPTPRGLSNTASAGRVTGLRDLVLGPGESVPLFSCPTQHIVVAAAAPTVGLYARRWATLCVGEGIASARSTPASGMTPSAAGTPRAAPVGLGRALGKVAAYTLSGPKGGRRAVLGLAPLTLDREIRLQPLPRSRRRLEVVPEEGEMGGDPGVTPFTEGPSRIFAAASGAPGARGQGQGLTAVAEADTPGSGFWSGCFGIFHHSSSPAGAGSPRRGAGAGVGDPGPLVTAAEDSLTGSQRNSGVWPDPISLGPPGAHMRASTRVGPSFPGLLSGRGRHFGALAADGELGLHPSLPPTLTLSIENTAGDKRPPKGPRGLRRPHPALVSFFAPLWAVNASGGAVDICLEDSSRHAVLLPGNRPSCPILSQQGAAAGESGGLAGAPPQLPPTTLNDHSFGAVPSQGGKQEPEPPKLPPMALLNKTKKVRFWIGGNEVDSSVSDEISVETAGPSTTVRLFAKSKRPQPARAAVPLLATAPVGPPMSTRPAVGAVVTGPTVTASTGITLHSAQPSARDSEGSMPAPLVPLRLGPDSDRPGQPLPLSHSRHVVMEQVPEAPESFSASDADAIEAEAGEETAGPSPPLERPRSRAGSVIGEAAPIEEELAREQAISDSPIEEEATSPEGFARPAASSPPPLDELAALGAHGPFVVMRKQLMRLRDRALGGLLRRGRLPRPGGGPAAGVPEAARGPRGDAPRPPEPVMWAAEGDDGGDDERGLEGVAESVGSRGGNEVGPDFAPLSDSQPRAPVPAALLAPSSKGPEDVAGASRVAARAVSPVPTTRERAFGRSQTFSSSSSHPSGGRSSGAGTFGPSSSLGAGGGAAARVAALRLMPTEAAPGARRGPEDAAGPSGDTSRGRLPAREALQAPSSGSPTGTLEPSQTRADPALFSAAQVTRSEVPQEALGASVYELAVAVSTGPSLSAFGTTRIVTVRSRFTLENRSQLFLLVKQRGTSEDAPLVYGSLMEDGGPGQPAIALVPPGHSLPIHWPSSSLPFEISLKPTAPPPAYTKAGCDAFSEWRPAGAAGAVPEAGAVPGLSPLSQEQLAEIESVGWSWSGGFAPGKSKDDYVGLRIRSSGVGILGGRSMILPLHMASTEASANLITIKNPNSLPPYRIENLCSDVTVRVAQLSTALLEDGTRSLGNRSAGTMGALGRRLDITQMLRAAGEGGSAAAAGVRRMMVPRRTESGAEDINLGYEASAELGPEAGPVAMNPQTLGEIDPENIGPTEGKRASAVWLIGRQYAKLRAAGRGLVGKARWRLGLDREAPVVGSTGVPVGQDVLARVGQGPSAPGATSMSGRDGGRGTGSQAQKLSAQRLTRKPSLAIRKLAARDRRRTEREKPGLLVRLGLASGGVDKHDVHDTKPKGHRKRMPERGGRRESEMSGGPGPSQGHARSRSPELSPGQSVYGAGLPLSDATSPVSSTPPPASPGRDAVSPSTVSQTGDSVISSALRRALRGARRAARGAERGAYAAYTLGPGSLTLRPGTAAPFAWDEPQLPHVLTVEAFPSAAAGSAAGVTWRHVLTHVPLDRLGDLEPIMLPSAGMEQGQGRIPRVATPSTLTSSLAPEIKAKLSALLASELSKRVYVSVYADGPTRVLRFSSTTHGASRAAEAALGDIADRISQVKAQLDRVNLQFSKFRGREGGGVDLDVLARGDRPAAPVGHGGQGLGVVPRHVAHNGREHVHVDLGADVDLTTLAPRTNGAGLGGAPHGPARAGSALIEDEPAAPGPAAETKPVAVVPRRPPSSIIFSAMPLAPIEEGPVSPSAYLTPARVVPGTSIFQSRTASRQGLSGVSTGPTATAAASLPSHSGSLLRAPSAAPLPKARATSSAGTSGEVERPERMPAAEVWGGDAEFGAPATEIEAEQVQQEPSLESSAKPALAHAEERERQQAAIRVAQAAAGPEAVGTGRKPEPARAARQATDLDSFIGGTLDIKVMEAQGLLLLGRTSPSTLVEAEVEGTRRYTGVQYSTVAPQWSEQLSFPLVLASSDITFTLYDISPALNSRLGIDLMKRHKRHEVQRAAAKEPRDAGGEGKEADGRSGDGSEGSPSDLLSVARVLGTVTVPLRATLQQPTPSSDTAGGEGREEEEGLVAGARTSAAAAGANGGGGTWFVLSSTSGERPAMGRIRLGFQWTITARSLLLSKLQTLESTLDRRSEALASIRPLVGIQALQWLHGGGLAKRTLGRAIEAPTERTEREAGGPGAGLGLAPLGGPAIQIATSRATAGLDLGTLGIRVIAARDVMGKSGALRRALHLQRPHETYVQVNVSHCAVGPSSRRTGVAGPSTAPEYEPPQGKRPFWSFEGVPLSANVEVFLMAKQRLSRSDEELGRAAVPCTKLFGPAPVYVWLPLHPPPSKRPLFSQAHKEDDSEGEDEGDQGQGSNPRHAHHQWSSRLVGRGHRGSVPRGPEVLVRLRWKPGEISGPKQWAQVKLAGVGIMVLATSMGRELLHVSATDVSVDALWTRLEEKVVGSVKAIQVDDQNPDSLNPVVLCPADRSSRLGVKLTGQGGGGSPMAALPLTPGQGRRPGGSSQPMEDLIRWGWTRSFVDVGSTPEVGGPRAIPSFKGAYIRTGPMDMSADDSLMSATIAFAARLPLHILGFDLNDLWLSVEEVEAASRQGRAAQGPGSLDRLAWLARKEARLLASARAASTSSSYVFMESLSLGDIDVNATIRLTSGAVFTAAMGPDPVRNRRAPRSRLEKWLAASGFQLVNASDVPLHFSGVEFKSTLVSWNALASNLTRHYLRQSLIEAHKVLGGVGPSVAGVPLAFLWAVSSTFAIGVDLARRKVGPGSAIQRMGYNINTAVGLLLGAASRTLTAGMALLPPGMDESALGTGMLGPGWTAMSDEAALARYIIRPRSAPEAMSTAVRELGMGFAAGSFGLIRDPVIGVAKGGIAPIVAGTLRGILGVTARPLAGLLESGSRFTQGIGLASLGKEGFTGPLTDRLRTPQATLYRRLSESLRWGYGPGADPEAITAAALAEKRALEVWWRALPSLHPFPDPLGRETLLEVLRPRRGSFLLLTDRCILMVETSQKGSGAGGPGASPASVGSAGPAAAAGAMSRGAGVAGGAVPSGLVEGRAAMTVHVELSWAIKLEEVTAITARPDDVGGSTIHVRYRTKFRSAVFDFSVPRSRTIHCASREEMQSILLRLSKMLEGVREKQRERRES